MIETAVAFCSGGLSDSIASFNFQGPVRRKVEIKLLVQGNHAIVENPNLPKLARDKRLGFPSYVVFDKISDRDACNGHVLFARVGVHRSFARNLGGEVLDGLGARSDDAAVGLEDTNTADLDLFIDGGVGKDELAGGSETRRGLHSNATGDFADARSIVFVAHGSVAEFVDCRLLGIIGFAGRGLGFGRGGGSDGSLSGEGQREQQHKEGSNRYPSEGP